MQPTAHNAMKPKRMPYHYVPDEHTSTPTAHPYRSRTTDLDPRSITAGHQTLETSHGDLDVLGSMAGGAEYETLLPDTVVLDLEGLRVRVLELSRVIAAKEAAGRPKDMAVLPLLRATLDEIRKRRGGD